MKTNILFIYRSVLYRMKNVTNVVEKMKKPYFVFSFFNRAVYDIMWKNNVERGRPRMKIWRMRISR
jgi:uncharacterized membrane protein